MNISKKLKGLLAACVAAVGLTAFAAPKLTVGEVKTGEPWSKVTVNYTIGGTVAVTKYKVAFDVTAGGQTASVTNDVVNLENKQYSQELDTASAKLFGKQVADPQAKVKVSLIAINPKTLGVQLWKDGPFWAETNLGDSEVQGHSDYGALYKFDNADAAVKSLLGQEWRVPSKADFEKLVNTSYCTRTWNSARKGYTFTGKAEGYTDKSIFLPAAGSDNGGGRKSAGGYGYYWSSGAGDGRAWYLSFVEGNAYVRDLLDRGNGLSVRAVR